MQLIRKFNKGVRFLLCIIDMSKYIDSVNMYGLFFRKIKKGIIITNAFQKI